MSRELVIFITALLVFSVVVGLISGSRKASRHDRYLAQARRLVGRLRRGHREDVDVLCRLRECNPYVFEEVVLLCLKDAGFRVKRNASYSGDGGIDGRAGKDGEEYFIQCKRYTSAINPVHVSEFTALCRRHACLGLFVHTGRTGGKSRVATDGGPVEFISGRRLVWLVRDGRYAPSRLLVEESGLEEEEG